MILVDTSIIIDALKNGCSNPKSKLLKKIIEEKTSFAISIYTFHEVLQGAKDEHEFDVLKEYLSSLNICYLPNKLSVYEKSAKVYYDLRRKGKTVRSIIDVLITQTAIQYDLFLLHNDRDFDIIAENSPELKILDASL